MFYTKLTVSNTEQTTLAGVVRTEMVCKPVENEEYRRRTEAQKKALKSKKDTPLLNEETIKFGASDFGLFIVRHRRSS